MSPLLLCLLTPAEQQQLATTRAHNDVAIASVSVSVLPVQLTHACGAAASGYYACALQSAHDGAVHLPALHQAAGRQQGTTLAAGACVFVCSCFAQIQVI